MKINEEINDDFVIFIIFREKVRYRRYIYALFSQDFLCFYNSTGRNYITFNFI